LRLNIFILLFFIFTNSDLIGQNKKFDEKKPANNIGIEIGPSLSQNNHYTKPDDNLVFDFRLGYIGGVFFQYNFNSHFSLRTDISYKRKLITSHIIFFNIIENKQDIQFWKNSYNYLMFPLIAKYSIKKNMFFIDAGTYVDLLLSSKFNYKYYNYSHLGDNSKDYRWFVSGLSIGIGTNLPINKKCDMSFEIRDCYGLTRIGKFIGYNTPFDNGKTSLNSVEFLYSLTYHLEK